jgi:hypothetical protein
MNVSKAVCQIFRKLLNTLKTLDVFMLRQPKESLEKTRKNLRAAPGSFLSQDKIVLGGVLKKSSETDGYFTAQNTLNRHY